MKTQKKWADNVGELIGDSSLNDSVAVITRKFTVLN